MKRLLAVSGLLSLALLAPVASAQSTSVYLYDVHGRLRAATEPAPSWNGWSAYRYDGADNRSVRQRQYLSPPSAQNELTTWTGLLPEQELVSLDGRFRLRLQLDGNLVLYWGATALWSSNTSSGSAMWLVMQDDGNLVLYSPDVAPVSAVWHTVTSGNSGARLVLQNDGNLVIYNGWTAVWASGTGGH